VRWISKLPFKQALQTQTDAYTAIADTPVMVLCNHCDNPPCVRVCPTQATWKREDGIVAMDWHRCIGCRYCIAACPYRSRSFNWLDPRPYIQNQNLEFPRRTKGVVEKCTMC
jgi:molybdopterin-containing oxidoreductase family iron-sulfur binding subunit